MKLATDREGAIQNNPELGKIEQELVIYEELLRRWQKSFNLIGPATLSDVWTRHFADSAQALSAAPQARIWADIGSGAGFPGLVIALLLKDVPNAHIHLIEADKNKSGFLRRVSRETLAPVTIHTTRAEQTLSSLSPDAVCARALAPLSHLIALTLPSLQQGAIGVFLKGKEWREELTKIKDPGKLAINTLPSRTSAAGRIIVVRAERCIQ